MPNYQNAKIYKLWCHETDDIYIGSTIQSLSQRLAKHKSKSNKCNSHVLFEKSNNVMIELIENYPCENRDELNRREGELIRKNNCVNKSIAGRTQKEYNQDNREYIAEKQKQYREANRDKLLEQQKQHHQDNRDKILEYQKQYYRDNCNKILEQQKQHYENNRDKIQEYNKQYYDDNRDKLQEHKAEKIVCECGCEITRSVLARHRRSKTHIQLINN